MHGDSVASGLGRHPVTSPGPWRNHQLHLAADSAAEVVRHGRRWRVTQAGRSVVVDHLVGLLHLAVLLANPQREIPAVELVGGVNALLGKAGGPIRSAQPVLDPTAIRQYRARVAQLREQADDRRWSEYDWLVGQLSAASGLGGRTRGFTDDAERARIAVGKAIRRAIDRISEADPVIGMHLRDCVHTGIRCVYWPV
jgi:hypothetical protein